MVPVSTPLQSGAVTGRSIDCSRMIRPSLALKTETSPWFARHLMSLRRRSLFGLEMSMIRKPS